MAITPCGTCGLGSVDSCAVDAEATGSASAGQGECSRNTQLAISKREPLPLRGGVNRLQPIGGGPSDTAASDASNADNYELLPAAEAAA